MESRGKAVSAGCRRSVNPLLPMATELSALADFRMQARSGHFPVALDCFCADFENRGRFFEAEAGEIAEFHNPALTRFGGFQPFERRFQSQQRLSLFGCQQQIFIEVYSDAAMPFTGVGLPGVIDQDAPHGTGSSRKEMAAVDPFHGSTAGQTDECLMNERRRLQGMVGALASHRTARHLTKFFVNSFEELLFGAGVPGSDSLQEL
jgi:hypothetical protein